METHSEGASMVQREPGNQATRKRRINLTKIITTCRSDFRARNAQRYVRGRSLQRSPKPL